MLSTKNKILTVKIHHCYLKIRQSCVLILSLLLLIPDLLVVIDNVVGHGVAWACVHRTVPAGTLT